MRTLKKTLCLVLVLAMMVGLCAVGASAAKLDDYPDKDSIQNKEAVAILSALKVLEGDERGFRPADTLTRAEGAAIMTRLLASTGAGVSSFTDMASAAWAQPYVAYCEANGIIAGMGDGTFQPQATLTVAQFAKMMLCALGYDAKAEGLTGAAWEINTVKLVNKIDLAAGLTNLDYNAAITRDAAAQMAYNTLKATMVEYVGGVNVKTSDGTSIDVNVQASDIENNSYSYWNGGAHDDTLEFCENYFPNLKVKGNEPDDFGMPNNIWWMGDSRKDVNYTDAKKIISELAGNILATYDKNVMVSEKQIYTDAKATDTLELTVVENGQTLGTKLSISKTNGTSFPLSKYAGATIYLIDTSAEGTADYGIADKLIVEYPYLARVTGVTAATAAADRSITMTVYNTPTGTGSITYTTEEFARGDYVLVYPKVAFAGTPVSNEFCDVKAAESVKGTVNQVNLRGGDASALVIDNTTYSVGSANLANLGPKAGQAVSYNGYGLNTGLTAYLSNGFVLGVVADAVAYGDYVFVINTTAAVTDALGNSTQRVGYVKQDATTAIETLSGTALANNKWATATPGSTGTRFTEAKDGDTALTKPVSLTAISPDTPNLGSGVIADAKTVFVAKLPNGTYKAYTGIANMPGFTGITTDAYALVPNYTGAHAVAVYVDLTGATASTTSTDVIFLVSNAAGSTIREGAYTVYNYTAIVNGEKVTVKSTESTGLAAGLVTPTYDGNKYLSKTEKATGGTVAANMAAAAKISYADGIVTVDGSAYAIASDAVVYIYTSIPGTLATGSVDSLVGLEGTMTFTALTVSDKDKTIKTVYITK